MAAKRLVLTTLPARAPRSRQRGRTLGSRGVRVVALSAEEEDLGPSAVSCSFRLGDSTVSLETGRIGRQANAAVLAREGDTSLYTTVCSERQAAADASFLPLTVVYQERFSAAGRTSSGFVKRDGRQRDSDTLVSRLVDRPLRPLFADGFYNETQVLQLVLSWGGVRSADALAITAAGAAALISDLPFVKPVVGVRVGWLRGAPSPVVNPTVAQMEGSRLDLVVAGTRDAVLMIEGFADFISDDDMLTAVEAATAAMGPACDAIAEWAAKVGKPKDASLVSRSHAGIDAALDAAVGAQLTAAMLVGRKQERALACLACDVSAVAQLAPTFGAAAVSTALKAAHSRAVRGLLRSEGLRADGRGPSDVRPISSSAGDLPVVHGCALFTRGETQALAVVTLGGEADSQRSETLGEADARARFTLQYFFPPSSVGETGRVGAPSRRELGHGCLAERALVPCLPSSDDFPYAMRLESTITESNGSSSMATVCAGWLALRDAGVPLLRPVAGVAMGLLLPEQPGQRPVILTDILGSEDALGDMDWKIAGDENGVTAFQLDMKVEGITVPILREAIAAAKVARIHILGRMARCTPPPRGALLPTAPRVGRTRIDPSKAGGVIGAGGKNIRAVCEQTGATDIQIDAEGVVTITAPNQSALDAAMACVVGSVTELVAGTVFRGARVTSVLEFGALVEILPGKVGLCHVSELALQRVENVASVVKEGDLVDVKLLEINAKGQLRLSRRAVLEAASGVPGLAAHRPAAAAPPATPPPPRRESRITRVGA